MMQSFVAVVERDMMKMIDTNLHKGHIHFVDLRNCSCLYFICKSTKNLSILQSSKYMYNSNNNNNNNNNIEIRYVIRNNLETIDWIDRQDDDCMVIVVPSTLEQTIPEASRRLQPQSILLLPPPIWDHIYRQKQRERKRVGRYIIECSYCLKNRERENDLSIESGIHQRTCLSLSWQDQHLIHRI